MMKLTILAITIALTNAQTSTDAPVRDIIITATFIGDLGTTSVEDQATIITAVSAQVSDAFGVSPDAVSTTLASGSIVATSVITGPTIIPYSAPVILVSALGLTATGVEVNEIESEIETPEFNVGSGYRTGEGGSKGGEGGKGGERGSKGGERGNGERGSKGGERGSKGSVSTGSTSSEKGSGGSEKGSGEKGSGKGQGTGESGKGSGSAMTASAFAPGVPPSTSTGTACLNPRGSRAKRSALKRLIGCCFRTPSPMPLVSRRQRRLCQPRQRRWPVSRRRPHRWGRAHGRPQDAPVRRVHRKFASHCHANALINICLLAHPPVSPAACLLAACGSTHSCSRLDLMHTRARPRRTPPHSPRPTPPPPPRQTLTPG